MANEKEIKLKENEKLAKKGMKASLAYLDARGHEVVDKSIKTPYGEIDVVSKFEDILVFTDVSVYRNSTNKLPIDKCSAATRQKREQMMAHYLKDHDYVDMSVRWDTLSLLVITDDRALVRYHVNALGVG